ncbi:MAG: sigma-54-dependent Fis family transcriptional regulator [Myxococcales bacterium]|nr:sigma-54-dependent Fis family transcriptional regulator [Myxococcales bacterium]
MSEPTAYSQKNGLTKLFYRITQSLHAHSEDIATALDESMTHLADYGFVRPSIGVFDAIRDEIRIDFAHGLTEKQRRRCRFRRGDGIEGQVLARGESMLVAQMSEQTQFIDKSGSRDAEVQRQMAFTCTPIHGLNHEVIGTLSIDLPALSPRRLKWESRVLVTAAQLISGGVRIWRDRLEEETAFDDMSRRLKVRRVLRPRNLVGRSRLIEETFQLLDQVAPSELPVLIRGENGTGKEVIARTIHQEGNRSREAFISVNCGALSETKIESELFGHVRGALPGALQDRKGRFEMADMGTLFLDGIGDLPASIQMKILRILQDGELNRLGEERVRHVNVRLIVATNGDLAARVSNGQFREDLFYRLNVFPIHVPALRERKTDITLLADHFVEKHARQQEKDVARISTPAIDLMCAYHWPGNVRELENCIERAVLLAHDGVIRSHHLPPTLQTGSSSGTTKQGSLDTVVHAFEREVLIEAMKNAHGNMAAAARALETTPRILAYKLKKHHLHERLALRRRRSE